MNLGLAFYDLGRVHDALAVYNGIVPPTPDSAALHCDIGLALEGAGRVDEARSEYRTALRLNPGYAEALSGLRRLGVPATILRP